MTSILPGAPWLIAYRSMLGINKPYKLTLNGCDYVLWQNHQGEILALDNICPHMQSPLSNGWICESRNTIICRYHALEFDGEGRIVKKGESEGKPLAKKLELIVQDDLIWTYGNLTPRLPIPNLISQRIKGLNFLGVPSNCNIQAVFLDCIKINYDFNHQNGVHRDNFRICANHVEKFDKNGNQAKVIQTFLREKNTFIEIIKNPSLLAFPISMYNELEYSFPSTTLFKVKLPLGELSQFFILYPETVQCTRTFVLSYANWQHSLIKVPIIKNIIERSLSKSIAKIVAQDSSTLESLYSRQKSKVRLPQEEIMIYAEELYQQWNDNKIKQLDIDVLNHQ